MPTVNLYIERGPAVFGNFRCANGLYTGPVSYVTGGDSIAAPDVSLGDIENLILGVATNAALSLFRILVWNPATDKVLWLVATTGVEVANGTDLSSFTARFLAFGK